MTDLVITTEIEVAATALVTAGGQTGKPLKGPMGAEKGAGGKITEMTTGRVDGRTVKGHTEKAARVARAAKGAREAKTDPALALQRRRSRWAPSPTNWSSQGLATCS